VRAAGAAALLALAMTTWGCGLGYFVRAGYSEARILWRREPIARVLARPGLDAGLRERLELVLAARRFAADELGLRVGDSFSTFADVEGEATVWVVGAAYRDRLEAYTWWYPIVGRAPYKGFFARAEADALADDLGSRGLDVEVREATAFSTLGWFADPLLSTTAKAEPVPLVETVLHELFHATLYLPGQAVFNESVATFVGYRGAVAFFCDGPGRDESRCGRATRRWRAVRAHGRVLEHFARRLRAVYASAATPTIRERRRAALAARAAAALEREKFAGGDVSPPNNARLLGMLAYETDLGLLDRLAPPDRPLAPVIRSIVAAAERSPDPFDAVRTLARAR
jgi:predicted aminopeptidase